MIILYFILYHIIFFILIKYRKLEQFTRFYDKPEEDCKNNKMLIKENNNNFSINYFTQGKN